MTLEEAVPLVSMLPTDDKLRLIDLLARQLLGEPLPPGPRTGASLRGALKHLGPAPSFEEFQEARRDAWARFPRKGT